MLNKQHFVFSWVNLGLNSSCLCDYSSFYVIWWVWGQIRPESPALAPLAIHLAFSSPGTQCSKGAVAVGLLGGSASVCINAALTQNMPERVAGYCMMVESRETEIMT